jgi:hypothetical protein
VATRVKLLGQPYAVSTVPRRLPTRSNAWLIFDFVAFTVAFDNFTVPSLTIEPSSFAALRVAALRSPAFSTRTVQRQYSLVIIPTRRVRKAFAEPDKTELARRCIPGIAATVDPNIVPTSTSTSISSMPAAIKAVESTFA